jgi:ABC-type nitrate/sulfonate/bicarbonate transport system substrate-binding protein
VAEGEFPVKRIIFLVFLIFYAWNSNAAFAAMAKVAGEKVIIGLPTTSMSMLPIFFAQDKGLFREEGLDPQLVFVGGRLQVPALAAGEVDFSASAETVLRAAVQGLALKVVVYMNSRMAVSLIAAPDIKTIAGLKGRSIAVTSIGGSLDYAAREILAKNGLNPERDARFVGIAQSEQMIALSAGSIQAAMLTPPYDSMMEKKGFRRLVFVGDVLDYPQGGLATTDKKLRENPAQVKRVVRTMVRSLIRIRQNRDELVPYIANRWKMDTEFAASSYDTMLKSYSPNGSTSNQSIQSVIDSIKGRNPTIGISHVVNFVQLEEVQREMKIK